MNNVDEIALIIVFMIIFFRIFAERSGKPMDIFLKKKYNLFFPIINLLDFIDKKIYSLEKILKIIICILYIILIIFFIICVYSINIDIYKLNY